MAHCIFLSVPYTLCVSSLELHSNMTYYGCILLYMLQHCALKGSGQTSLGQFKNHFWNSHTIYLLSTLPVMMYLSGASSSLLSASHFQLPRVGKVWYFFKTAATEEHEGPYWGVAFKWPQWESRMSYRQLVTYA